MNNSKISYHTVRILALLFCIATAVCGVSAYAQTTDADEYKPMVEEGYEWGYYCEESPMPFDGHFYYRLQFLGDSIVEGTTYKKLYMYQTDNLNPDLQRPIALMREENRRVFMYPPDYLFEYDSSDYPADWMTLIRRFEFLSGMDNLIYDFSAQVDEPFLCQNYSFLCHRLIHKQTCEYSTGSETVYYSILNDQVHSFPMDLENIITRSDVMKTIPGVGAISFFYHGIMPFPVGMYTDCSSLYDHNLLYKRKLDGTMVFVNDENEEYMANDPTVNLSSVEDLAADGGDGVWIENGMLRGAGRCTVSSLSGVKLHSGVAEGYRFPASGIYLIKTDNRVLKVSVTL